MQTAEFVFQRFHVKMEDGSSRLLCVVINEEEGARVDFECYARQGSVAWEDLLSGEATEAQVLRVFLKAGSYYNYAFADEMKWRCFVATSPDVERLLYFYVARGAETAKQLAQFTARRSMRATLAVRSVEGSFEHAGSDFVDGRPGNKTPPARV